MGRGLRFRPGGLAATLAGLHLGLPRGPTGRGSPAGTLAWAEDPAARWRLPFDQGLDLSGQRGARLPEQSGLQAALDSHVAGADSGERLAEFQRAHPLASLRQGALAQGLSELGHRGLGRMPPPAEEDEEGTAPLADQDLLLCDRDRSASLEYGQDLPDLQGSLGDRKLLQGSQPVVQFGQAPLLEVPRESVLFGLAEPGL